MSRFRKGWRSGEGLAEAAVEPDSLVELWRLVQICVKHQRIIVTQAANTGLTEGSTPKDSYDRPVIVINTLRLILKQRMLSEHEELPSCGEYIHPPLFDVAHKYGNDTLLLIHSLGTD